MFKKVYTTLSGLFLVMGLVSMTLLIVHATQSRVTQGNTLWSTDTFYDFRQGNLDGIDIWTAPGTARLDRDWWPNARVNDYPLTQGRFAPRLSFVLSGTNGSTETVFLGVWADERVQDHYPDIYLARSTDGGASWSSDVLASGAHVSGRAQNTPDIAERAADESLWVVWQDDRRSGDDGDIFYATSADQGAAWSVAAPVYTGTGTQHLPRIAPHGSSGYLYAVWEDEQVGDSGDIYISRYNPDTMASWSTPVQVHDDVPSPAEQRNPALAVAASGNIYVVWEDLRENDDGEIYFSRWISGTAWNGGSWSTPARLSEVTMDWSADPDITVGPNDVLYAAWMERVPTGPATYDFQIVVGRSIDNEDNWSTSVARRLYSASASNAFYEDPAIGVDLSERVYIAWHHSPDQQVATADVLFSSSPDRGEHWTEPQILNRPSNKAVIDDAPTLAVGFNGQVVVAWQDYRNPALPQIYATGYPADSYLSNGIFMRTLDAGGLADWDSTTWTVTTAADTGLAVATRVMTEAGAGWTDWLTHAVSGSTIAHPSGRFLQLRTVLTSDGSSSLTLNEVVISYRQYRLFLPLVLKGN